MNANETLLLRDEVYQVVGCAIEVLNDLGHGLHEKPYENALVVEFGLRGVPHAQQPRYPVLYKGVNVGMHFRRAKLEWGRIVLSNPSQRSPSERASGQRA